MKHAELRSLLAQVRRLSGMKAPAGEGWAYAPGGPEASHVHVLEPRIVQVLLPGGRRVSIVDSQDHVTRIHLISDEGDHIALAMRIFHSIKVTGDTVELARVAPVMMRAVDAWLPPVKPR